MNYSSFLLVLAHLLLPFRDVVLLGGGVEGVDGSVQTLSSIQGDGMLMPRTHHTQTTMTVLEECRIGMEHKALNQYKSHVDL